MEQHGLETGQGSARTASAVVSQGPEQGPPTLTAPSQPPLGELPLPQLRPQGTHGRQVQCTAHQCPATAGDWASLSQNLPVMAMLAFL